MKKQRMTKRSGGRPRGVFQRNHRVFGLAAAMLLAVILCCGCHNPFLLEDVDTAPADEPETGTAVEESSQTPSTGEVVPEESSGSLTGFTICLDPGHGIASASKQEAVSPKSSETKPAYVSGAVGNSQTEEEVNLAVAEKLKAKLEADGATVIMTRTTHEATVSNIERAEMANEAGANLCVRIHADGSDNKSIHGISVLVPEGNLLGTPAIVEPSRSAGEAVHDALIAATGAEDHGIVVRTDLTGFNWSEVPVILVEMGFLSNDEEDAKLATDEYREILAEGMHQGIRNWLMNQ